MFDKESWQEIFETIKKNKLRTFLSGFTVALGIFIFIILFGMGNGLKNTFQEFFLDDATNVLFIHPGRTTIPYKGFKANRQIEFKNSDLENIKENFKFYIEYITPRIYVGGIVRYGLESNSYQMRAVAPSHQHAEKTIIMKGRYINENDITHKAKVAVIGRLVKQDLFKKENPIGKFIDIRGNLFKVVGVFQDDGGDNEERSIYLPYTTQQLISKGTDNVNMMIVAFRKELGYVGGIALEKAINDYLKEEKNIAPFDNSAVFINNVSSDLKEAQGFAGVLQLIVTFVGMGTLIAGIIGISNIMVFVVKERTKELGIRKAIGATPRSVIKMILQEAIFITTISGIIGLFIGVFVLNNLGLKLEPYFIKNPYISLTTAIFATCILIIFGSIAGYVPAKRAAKIKPVIALRDE